MSSPSILPSRQVLPLLMLALWEMHSSSAFSLLPNSSSQQQNRALCRPKDMPRKPILLHQALRDEEEDDDDDDDDDYIDTDSLGDWRNFRRSLSMLEEGNEDPEQKKEATKTVSKENEELLRSQNEALHEEYMTGVWAHETSTPEVGGLVVRMPLEVELYRNHKHSIMGRRLQRQLEGENVEIGVWYARAKNLIESEMQKIALKADDVGQIDATKLGEESSELLGLFLDNQETWQEVCLVLENEGGNSKTLVLNRPMAFKLTENLGKLVLQGAFTPKNTNDMKLVDRRDLMRFMMAFSAECAVYVGGPDNQGDPAIMIHGIPDLPGAEEISPGSRIYRGGVDAAVDGVLEGKYSPLEFRFFVGCHEFDESGLDVAVHLGKYQPIACARSVALKQCISLPKPLWHEVLELCGGTMVDLSTLELMKRDDIQFQVVDETEYDEDDDDGDEIIIDEFDVDSFDDDDDDA
mmetsp:Transcript_110192/g.318487  ORF Transcript_110192/g.318487 Transcript_110192/m.318487 type:complete len:465 (-) Transcript_110192:212-1606(-)